MSSAEGHQRVAVVESGCLRVQPEFGWYTPPKAKYHGGRPIANKYFKGKMKRTLKRECKELEIVGREAIAEPAQGAGRKYQLPDRLVRV